MKTLTLISAMSALSIALSASAQTSQQTDTTAGTAVNDGTINGGEYATSATGINSGFGNVIGSNSRLWIDSSTGGALNLGLRSGGGNMNDIVVVYIDSVAGGFSSTATLNDAGDNGRRAISGGIDGGGSEITFASGFMADYALTIEAGFSGLFSLAAGNNNSLGFVTSANLTPSGNAAAQDREMNLSLSNLGLNAGGTFKYVATYISNTSFRSDEFIGVGSFSGGNPGFNNVTLGANDFNTFTAVPEPGSMAALSGLALAGFAAWRRRGQRNHG